MARIINVMVLAASIIISVASMSFGFANNYKWTNMPTHGAFVTYQFAKSTIQNTGNTDYIEVITVGKLKANAQKYIMDNLGLKKKPVYLLQVIVFDYANERYCSRVSSMFDANEKLIDEDVRFSEWSNFSESPIIKDLAMRVAKIVSGN